MISAYSSIVSYSQDDWEDYLEKICVIEVFKKLIKEYTDKIKLKCAIQFILYCYSVESEKVILGHDWQKNKQKIYEDTCTPTRDLYEDLVLLKNETVVHTIHRWLDFQNSDVHAEICMLKELKMELQISANTKIVKSSGEVDYTQKYLNATYVNELRKKIKDLESEFVQNNIKLKEAVREIKGVGKSKSTMGVERFAI